MVWGQIWSAIKSIGPVVIEVAKKVYNVLSDKKVQDVYGKIEKVLDTVERPVEPSRSAKNRAPDFYLEASGGSDKNSVAVEKRLKGQETKLAKQATELQRLNKFLALQVEFTRMRSSAELIDRAIRNAKMHAAGLETHWQNMRNINGLVEYTNRLSEGLDHVIGVVNSNVERANRDGGNQSKILGVNLDRTDGAISQLAAYDAFDKARQLLTDEVITLAELSERHLQELGRMREHAADYGGSVGEKVLEHIDRDLVPLVRKARNSGVLLRSDLMQLPVPARHEDGRLVLDDQGLVLKGTFRDVSLDLAPTAGLDQQRQTRVVASRTTLKTKIRGRS